MEHIHLLVSTFDTSNVRLHITSGLAQDHPPRPRPRPRPQKSGLDRSRDQDQVSRPTSLQISGVGMGMGFAPTWLRQVSPPPLHKTTVTTDLNTYACKLPREAETKLFRRFPPCYRKLEHCIVKPLVIVDIIYVSWPRAAGLNPRCAHTSIQGKPIFKPEFKPFQLQASLCLTCITRGELLRAVTFCTEIEQIISGFRSINY